MHAPCIGITFSIARRWHPRWVCCILWREYGRRDQAVLAFTFCFFGEDFFSGLHTALKAFLLLVMVEQPGCIAWRNVLVFFAIYVMYQRYRSNNTVDFWYMCLLQGTWDQRRNHVYYLLTVRAVRQAKQVMMSEALIRCCSSDDLGQSSDVHLTLWRQ